MKKNDLFTKNIIEDLVNSGKVKSLVNVFDGLSEWRRCNNNFKYPLDRLMLVITLALISGFNSMRGFSDFTSLHPDIMGTPSKTTFQRILSELDEVELKNSLFEWLIQIINTLGIDTNKQIISIDGKTLRNHIDQVKKDNNQASKLTSLNLVYQDLGIVFNSLIYDSLDTGEVVMLRNVINQLADNIVTADAVHCNQETMLKLAEKNQKFLIASKYVRLNSELLKRGTILKEESIICKRKIEKKITVYSIPNDFYIYYGKYYDSSTGQLLTPKGKISKVKVTTESKRFNWMSSGINTLIKVQTESKGEQVIRYYVSNLTTDLSVEEYEKIIRTRWEVENFHRYLDTTFKQDHMTLKNIKVITNLNTLLAFVISIFHINDYPPTTKTSKMFCNIIDKSLKLIGLNKILV